MASIFVHIVVVTIIFNLSAILAEYHVGVFGTYRISLLEKKNLLKRRRNHLKQKQVRKTKN
jgi:hypothetical protein